MSHPHRTIAPTVALTLALAAATAPAASGDPAPLAQAESAIANTSTHPTASPAPCGDVCSGHGYGSVNQPAWTPDESGATLPHNPRPRSIALAGSGHSAASVTTHDLASPAPCGDVCSGHGYGNVDVVALSPSVRSTPTAAPNGGFDWGDAGLGAGGTLALILIGAGGVLTVARRRGHTETPTPRPNPQAQH